MKWFVLLAGLSPLASAAQDAPVCACQTQCSAMWAEATNALSAYTGMRLRIATDTMAETYVPRVGVYGAVSMRPLGGGSYAVDGLLRSRPDSGAAADLAAQGTYLLNNRVSRVAQREKCLPSP